jgi:hypothetical protein
MADNKFDEFLRNRILNYSSPVPEDMWQRIQKKRKNRILFFILWLLAICLIFFLGGYLIFHSNKNTISNTPIINNKLLIKNPIVPGKIIKNPGIQRANIGTTDSLQFNQKNVSISNQFENKQDKKLIYKNKKHTKNDKIIFTVAGSKNIQSGDATDSSIKNTEVAVRTTKEEPDTLSRQLNKPSLLKDSSITKKLNASTDKSRTESEKSRHKNKEWFLEAYVSPDFPYFQRTDDNTNINDHGKSAPTSYTIGVRVSEYFSERLSVKTGIQYSQISEKFFDSLIIVDRCRSIDIPFLIGYDLTTNSFKTTINAGIIYNIYSWYKGLTLIDYRGLIDINVANIYKRNTGVSLYLGMNLSKKINDKIEVIAEPYFRYRLSFMTRSSAPFNQKINIAGLNIGVRYNFRKHKKHK